MSDSVQWAMLAPVVLLAVLGILQLGLWGYARTLALNAAGAGAEEAAPATASLAGGEAVATYLAHKGGLVELTVSCRLQAGAVTCRVGGTVPGLIDVGVNRIDAQATRPKERVTAP
nr:hypothetical protein [Propionibacterium sp.]